jgi:hypothetical protein
MKIVGLGNCTTLRKYVDGIVMKNLHKGQSKYYNEGVKEYIFLVIKRKLIHEDYSLIKLDGKFISEMTDLINIIMTDYCKNYLRKEKVKKIQYRLKNEGHKLID